MQQRSEEWYQARLGKATASRFGDVIATIRNGEAAARKNYRTQLVLERLTGHSSERYRSKPMDWGVETEELARLAYQLKTGTEVEETGFIEHPKLAAGASPDGLIGKDGTFEAKCLNSANHVAVLRSQAILPEYIPQIQGQLWITGRKWCDFASYDPELPPNAQLFVQRIERDDTFIRDLEYHIKLFLQEVDAEEKFLREYK